MATLIDSFGEFNFLEWTVFLGSFIYLFGAWVSYKNYNKTGSREYLFLLALMLTGIPHAMLLPLVFHYSSKYLSFLMAFFGMAFYALVIIHTTGLRWEKPPRAVYLLSTFFISVVLFDIITNFFSLNILTELNLQWIGWELARLSVALLMIYSYSTFEVAFQSSRIRSIKMLWVLFGSVQVLNGLINLFSYFLFQTTGAALANWNSLPYYICVSLLFSLLLIILVYPEAMLLSHVQILKASKLFDQVENLAEKDSNDRILNYLLQVKKENPKLFDIN